ncbi:hypothetical protein ACSQ67_007695 [Phaseolus vulgaris]
MVRSSKEEPTTVRFKEGHDETIEQLLVRSTGTSATSVVYGPAKAFMALTLLWTVSCSLYLRSTRQSCFSYELDLKPGVTVQRCHDRVLVDCFVKAR